MTEKVTTLDMRRSLGDILNRVSLRHDEFVIERKGKPLAALVPVEKLEELTRMARRFLLDSLRRRKPSSLTQEEADGLADEAKHRSRKGRRS